MTEIKAFAKHFKCYLYWYLSTGKLKITFYYNLPLSESWVDILFGLPRLLFGPSRSSVLGFMMLVQSVLWRLVSGLWLLVSDFCLFVSGLCLLASDVWLIISDLRTLWLAGMRLDLDGVRILDLLTSLDVLTL